MAHTAIGKLRDAVQSDTVDIESFDWIMVNGAGTLKVTHETGAITTLALTAPNMLLPMEGGVRVWSTGTTATGIQVV